ncbi:MAG: hypothetical protein U1D99_03745 [Candidatus Omnitrophota bacterium]|nr:hypothetical protein [Candidatus Omnitrophota bacterium]
MISDNAKIQYESGQDLVEFVALTDQGDHMDFRSADALWSKRAGYTADVKPNGLATGGVVSAAASGSNDVVDVAALTGYLAGVLTTVGAGTDEAVTRPTGGSPANSHNKSSITVNSAGALAVVKGTDGTAFSTTRGAAGGPPWIPTGSFEVAQVWLSSATPAAIVASEVKQVPGTHQEQYDYPVWEVKTANVSSGILGLAGILFASALSLIHSDDAGSTTAGKKVYAEYYEPIFTDIPKTESFVPPETSHSVSSKQYYGGTLGSTSSSLNQGSFTAYMETAIYEGFQRLKNELLWFKFFQNRLNSTPYILAQGKLGVSRTYPAADHVTAACTVSADEAAHDVAA